MIGPRARSRKSRAAGGAAAGRKASETPRRAAPERSTVRPRDPRSAERAERDALRPFVWPGSGRGIRTPDLRVMSPVSYRCSIPRRRAPV